MLYKLLLLVLISKDDTAYKKTTKPGNSTNHPPSEGQKPFPQTKTHQSATDNKARPKSRGGKKKTGKTYEVLLKNSVMVASETNMKSTDKEIQ